MLRRTLLAFVVLLSACCVGCVRTAKLPERPRLVCPPPPQPPCKPERFTEVVIDTSSAPSRVPGYHLAINRVDGLNTAADEFSVAFQTPGDRLPMQGLATVRPKPDNAEWIVPATFDKVDVASPSAGINMGGIDGAVGGGVSSARGDSVLFTAHGRTGLAGDYDVFSGLYSDGKLRAASESPVSAPSYWDAQPAMSPDGKSLYFVSNREGGLGGTDLYVSRMGADGAWAEPENLGPGINTPCDELSPFVASNGRMLYFSSAGHQTVGGYDLFRARISGNDLSGAENLGMPINTTFDEIFPSSPSNVSTDTLFYWSSNQQAGTFDMYVLHRKKRQLLANAPLEEESIKLTGTVRNKRGQTFDSAMVRLEEGDPPKAIDSTRTNKYGRYEFPIKEGRHYEVSAGTDSTLFGREKILVPKSNDKEIINKDIILPDTITFRVNFPFNNATDPYEFTLDDSGLPTTEAWSDVIDRAATYLRGMQRKYVIQVVGHTDPIGSDAFNIDLGRRRAEFVKRELVKRGVPADRLVVRSEGESSPLPMHEGEQDELYRARLRRVELMRK